MEASRNKDFFAEFGLELGRGEVEVGRTYPIFGIITNVVDESAGRLEVEINGNIRARMVIPDPERINIIKQRAFESGIFISKVTETEPQIVVDCQTVIFGRSQSYHA